MIEALDPIEQRIIGCLLEKSVTTPDQYPLTLNALIAACNQKSSREPVMKLTPGEVEGCANRLAERHLVVRDENFKSRVTKYSHRFCNTPFGDLELDPPAYAILTLMLLRGPQTPGELRARSPRLHVFEDNGAVEATLEALICREPDPLVLRLSKRSGRRDFEYTHRFSTSATAVVSAPRASPINRELEAKQESTQEPENAADIRARIESLQAEIDSLTRKLHGDR